MRRRSAASCARCLREDDRTQEVADDLRRAEQTLENVQFRSAAKTSERARNLVVGGQAP